MSFKSCFLATRKFNIKQIKKEFSTDHKLNAGLQLQRKRAIAFCRTVLSVYECMPV